MPGVRIDRPETETIAQFTFDRLFFMDTPEETREPFAASAIQSS